MEISCRRSRLLGARPCVLVLLVGLWLTAHGSAEGDALTWENAKGKVCIVRANTRVKVDEKSGIVTANIAYGGKSPLSTCVNTCGAHPTCKQVLWDVRSSKCYRNQEFTGSTSEDPTGASTVRCEPSATDQTKVCKVHQMTRHINPSKENQMDTGDVKFGAKVGTENECMSACALSEGCMETTFSQKDKRCFPSKQAVVHEVTDGTGDFWTMQCHSLTPDEIKTTGADGVDAPVKKEEQEQAAKAQAGNTTQAQQPQAGNQTQAQAQEIDAELNKKKQPTPAEAKQEKKDAAEKAKAAKAEAKEKEEELKKEKAEKKKLKLKEQAAEAKAKADKAMIEKAKGEKKEKAIATAKAAEEKMQKDKEKQAALEKEGASKKEKRAKAQEKADKLDKKKESAEKGMRVAKMAKEKRNKSDKWYKKGHLLFAQGIKYQGLLEKYSTSHNKLDAYHYKRELETYTDAFPQGFVAPLNAEDGTLGKTTPAGVDVTSLQD